MKGDPKFEISSAYPEMNTYYGLLVGLCYSVPYALSGLYAGSLTKGGNRKIMMIAVVSALSLFQITSGTVNSLIAEVHILLVFIYIYLINYFGMLYLRKIQYFKLHRKKHF